MFTSTRSETLVFTWHFYPPSASSRDFWRVKYGVTLYEVIAQKISKLTSFLCNIHNKVMIFKFRFVLNKQKYQNSTNINKSNKKNGSKRVIHRVNVSYFKLLNYFQSLV